MWKVVLCVGGGDTEKLCILSHLAMYVCLCF